MLPALCIRILQRSHENTSQDTCHSNLINDLGNSLRQKCKVRLLVGCHAKKTIWCYFNLICYIQILEKDNLNNSIFSSKQLLRS